MGTRRSRLQLLALLAVLGTFAQEMRSQAIQSKTASVGAPKTASLSEATRSFAPPQAFVHLHQSKLSDHHLPIPVHPKPTGTRSFRPVLKGPETLVFTMLSGADVKISFSHAFVQVETEGYTTTVSEPTLAVRGEQALVTANWFASFTKDGGNTFQHIVPWDLFPQDPSKPFCCDQVTIYDPVHDSIIWVLQYDKDSDGNFLRLAVAKGDDITNQKWRYYDLSPLAIGGWHKEWFDFPNLTVSDNYLYISSNAYSTETKSNPDGTLSTPFTRSLMMRVPLQQLTAYQPFTLNFFDTQEYGGLRATQGAVGTMYFATNRDAGQLRVFTWPESSSALSFDDVTLQDWDVSKARAIGPDGNDWMGRVDTRLTAAWANNGILGFAWTAPQDNFFRFPQVRIALLKSGDKSVVAQPIIWNNEFAFALPAVSTSSTGDLGLSLHYGGNTHHPSHAVGILHAVDAWKTGQFTLSLVAGTIGQHGPADSEWGDYGTVRPVLANPGTWATVGYTLQGTQSDIQLDFVRFTAIHQ